MRSMYLLILIALPGCAGITAEMRDPWDRASLTESRNTVVVGRIVHSELAGNCSLAHQIALKALTPNMNVVVQIDRTIKGTTTSDKLRFNCIDFHITTSSRSRFVEAGVNHRVFVAYNRELLAQYGDLVFVILDELDEGG